MAEDRDPYAWIRGLFLRHPPLLPRLLQLCTGLRPPAAITAEEREGEILLSAQGGEAPWYVLSIVARPDPAKVSAWPLLWLDVAEEQREDGWHVVLTDSREVMDWLEGPDFRPRYGVGFLPLALDLSHQVEVLRRPGEPLLTALALWTARDRPEERAAPILRQLCAELIEKDEPLLAVPLLAGVRAFGPPWACASLLATPPPGLPTDAPAPAWWPLLAAPRPDT